jgi:hypothetical protein
VERGAEDLVLRPAAEVRPVERHDRVGPVDDHRLHQPRRESAGQQGVPHAGRFGQRRLGVDPHAQRLRGQQAFDVDRRGGLRPVQLFADPAREAADEVRGERGKVGRCHATGVGAPLTDVGIEVAHVRDADADRRGAGDPGREVLVREGPDQGLAYDVLSQADVSSS